MHCASVYMFSGELLSHAGKKTFKKLPLYFFTLYFPFTVFLLTSYFKDYQLLSYNKTDSVRKTKSVYCL